MAGEAARPQPTPLPLIRTPDQRLRVFVSSTLQELAAERAAARRAVEQLRLTPVLFELGARPHAPRDLYRAYLDQSHVFVGIYGQRYGWVAPGETVSGVEDEYRLSGYRPKLIYVKRIPGKRDGRLDELIDRIKADDVASYRMFGSADELRELVENDLAVLLTERFEQPEALAGAQAHQQTPTNLPVPRSDLVGREREVAAACDLLGDHAHLVTLTGPGGCGKSRLALEIALRLLDRFEDGVYLVMLESIGEPSMVVPAIAEALGVREMPGRPRLDSLCDHLRDAHALLVLDNFEQVVEAAPNVSALLERCPRLASLATSRTPLRVRGERELPIPPLPTPAAFDADLDSLSQYAAVALFARLARGVRADFAITDQNAPTIAEICHRLDGLPLAIELAAARLKFLSPEALLARLTSRFEVLRGGTRDLPERHRALRKAIDWSHDLLDVAEQRMFRRLSVFAGGSTLEAAEAIGAGNGDGADALDTIASLVDSSMLTTTLADDGGMRIGMLETLRAYGMEKLTESGEVDVIRRRHAEFYCALGEQAKSHLTGPSEPHWASRLSSERDNLRLALEWATEHDIDLGLRLGDALFRFWEAHNGIVEGHRWLTALLAQPSPPDATRGKALRVAAALGCYIGDYEAARRQVREALEIFERLGDEWRIATALNELGVIAAYEGSYQDAVRFLDASLEIKQRLGDDTLTATTIVNQGLVAGWRGDHARSYELHAESLAIYRRLDERLGTAIATHNLADAAMHLGRMDEAVAGQVASLRLFDEIGDADGRAECLEALALLANARGDARAAARLFARAAVSRGEAGTQAAPYGRAEVEHGVAEARSRLDEATFEAEWQTGREISILEALALAESTARVTVNHEAAHGAESQSSG